MYNSPLLGSKCGMGLSLLPVRYYCSLCAKIYLANTIMYFLATRSSPGMTNIGGKSSLSYTEVIAATVH